MLTDINAGTFTNTATATGNPPTGSPVTDQDDDTQTLPLAASITLAKTGTLDMTVVAPSDRADAGDKINYAFTVTNTGNVTLTGITVTDPKLVAPNGSISGGPITLAPGASDATTFTGSYTLTLTDINAGTFTNTATATGNPPTGSPVTDQDDDTQTLPLAASITLARQEPLI